MSGIARAWRIAAAGIVMTVFGGTIAWAAEGNREKDAHAPKQPEQDIIKTETGDLKITFIGHGR